MDNILSGGIAELEEAKKRIVEEADLTQQVQALEATLNAKQKDLKAQRKYMNDKISTTTRDRRNELKKSHDSTIGVANKAVKDAENKRKMAKADAVKERIKNETAELVAGDVKWRIYISC